MMLGVEMAKRLVVYTRDVYCPDQTRVRQLLAEWGVAYQEINCSQDSEALERIRNWNGHLGVPTLVVAEEDSVLPIAEPDPFPVGRSTRNVNRSTLISEPSEEGLREFLRQHGLLP